MKINSVVVKRALFNSFVYFNIKQVLTIRQFLRVKILYINIRGYKDTFMGLERIGTNIGKDIIAWTQPVEKVYL